MTPISAAYAAKSDWTSSANDAEKCININPSFIKGYFRLAKAQKERGKFDDALATVKKGLAIDSIDNEHKKQMRKFKVEVKEAKAEYYRNNSVSQMQHFFGEVFGGLIGQSRDLEMERQCFERELPCMHGVNPMSAFTVEGRICREFRKTFLDGFNNATFRTQSYRLGERFQSAFDATVKKFGEVWRDESKIRIIVENLVGDATVTLLQGKVDDARIYASYSFFIQDASSVLINNDRQPNCTRVCELYDADEHTLVSYLKKLIPCKCLDQKYKEVRSISKMTQCYNENCSLPRGEVEQSKATCCSRCRRATYCSRSCQVQDWPRHKIVCGVNTVLLDNDDARKSAYDALEALLVADAAGSADKNTNTGG